MTDEVKPLTAEEESGCYCGGDIDDMLMDGTAEEQHCTHCPDDRDDYRDDPNDCLGCGTCDACIEVAISYDEEITSPAPACSNDCPQGGPHEDACPVLIASNPPLAEEEK